MLIGTTLQLSSMVLNPQGHELPNKEHSSWMSSNPAVATVDTTGLVTAIDSGRTFVIALHKKTADSVRVHVVPVPVAKVVITPATLTLEVGQSDTLVATTLDSIGGVLSGRRIEWSSNSTNVATVDTTGIVTAQHEGTAWIRATSEGKSDSTATLVEVPHLSVVTGPPASGTVGTALSQPLVVRLTGSSSGRPIQGTSVVFAPVRGGGTLSPSSAMTDADGRASTQWVLGTTAGRDSATASVTGADPLGFGVDALAGEPANVTYVSGSGQSGIIDQPLAAPLVVRATDQYGNLVRSVRWSSAAGAPLQDSVASNGNLYATWKVTRAGTDTAFAVAGSDTARFIATVSPAGPPTLTLASDPTPPFTVAKATRVNVVLRDGNGNPVPGSTLTWTIASGAGSFSDNGWPGYTPVTTTATLTDAAGNSSVDWYLGRTVGPNVLDVRAPGADPLTVSVTSTAGAMCESGISGGTGRDNYIGSGMVGTILPTVLTPYFYDAWGNATTGVASLPRVPDGGEAIRMSDGTLRIRLGTRARDVQMLYYWWICLGSSGGWYSRLQNGAFTATATPAPASTIAIAEGNAQNGFAGAELSAPLTVAIADQYGNATTGALTWAVTSGGGSISGSGPTVHWTLGSTAGMQHATATLDNGASVSFYATAIAVGSTITIVSGDGQTAAAGAMLPSTLVVQVTDGNGNPTSGVPITWSVTAGGGTIYGPGITDASGRTWARWTLGRTPGVNGASASVSGTALTVSFTATGS